MSPFVRIKNHFSRHKTSSVLECVRPALGQEDLVLGGSVLRKDRESKTFLHFMYQTSASQEKRVMEIGFSYTGPSLPWV